jgi:hypothetical protein
LTEAVPFVVCSFCVMSALFVLLLKVQLRYAEDISV